jgi:hypothetical protein
VKGDWCGGKVVAEWFELDFDSRQLVGVGHFIAIVPHYVMSGSITETWHVDKFRKETKRIYIGHAILKGVEIWGW